MANCLLKYNNKPASSNFFYIVQKVIFGVDSTSYTCLNTYYYGKGYACFSIN